ncbi:hypothetical protein [Nocardia asteroides]|uniref:hypothetical protein n=1 Tax=Nocardia asteroides TaxID=1824 RepID=UPI001E622A93|nr:hypothetical protein [Nocardia asteroides]UGT61811.1 hypothetical protein LTT61_00175 [Nocardia asteroides]
MLVSLMVFLPATFAARQALHVPEINARPRRLRNRPPHIATSYWITWIAALTALVAPAAILALFPRTRRVALGYALTATLLGAALSALVIGFELNGFAPD